MTRFGSPRRSLKDSDERCDDFLVFPRMWPSAAPAFPGIKKNILYFSPSFFMLNDLELFRGECNYTN